jgi:hypothetical protein
LYGGKNMYPGALVEKSGTFHTVKYRRICTAAKISSLLVQVRVERLFTCVACGVGWTDYFKII